MNLLTSVLPHVFSAFPGHSGFSWPLCHVVCLFWFCVLRNSWMFWFLLTTCATSLIVYFILTAVLPEECSHLSRPLCYLMMWSVNCATHKINNTKKAMQLFTINMFLRFFYMSFDASIVTLFHQYQVLRQQEGAYTVHCTMYTVHSVQCTVVL